MIGRVSGLPAALVVLVTLAPPASGQPAGTSGSTVKPARFDRPPIIDGRLDDEAWAAAAPIADFRQVHPGDNIPPSEETEVRIGYDSRALYLAFRARDSSGRVRATVGRRDAVADDDLVGVYLDTFNDQRRAYYVFFNPYGIQADGIYTEGQPDPDLSVDLVIESKGVIDAHGYTVEAAIPFASVRYRRGESSAWGLHVQRFIRRERNEQISWMPISRDRSGLLNQAGRLGDFVDAGEGRPLEVIVTGTATQAGTATATGFSVDPVEGEPGLTASLGVTPTFGAAITVNPDFAQVEADELVLTVNQRFPIFFDEKRPFFFDGSDVFQTPITLVHTRRIVAPDYAVKLAGKAGATTLGMIFAEDAGGKMAVRVKHDVGRESTVGAAVTSVRDDEEFSTVLAADTRVRLSDTTVLSAQVAGTWTDMPFKDPEAGGERQRFGRGFAYYAKAERRGRHATVALAASGMSPDYRAELGFTRRVNINNVALQTSYTSEPKPEARLISWTATNIAFAQWDWQGRANLVYLYPQLLLKFRRQSYLQAVAFHDYERLFEEEFGVRRGPGRPGAFAGDSERSTDWKGFGFQAGSAPSEHLSFSATWSVSWDVFDYDFGGGPKFPRVSPAALANPHAPLDPGPARSHSIGGDVVWRPTNAFRLYIEASRDTLVRNDTRRTAYDATLLSWNALYQFTPSTSVRLRTDWDSASASLRGQYLFGWTPNPGTALYVGFNDAGTIDGFDAISGVRAPGFRRTNRTLFVKASYLLRAIL